MYVWKIWTATPYLNIGGKGWKREKKGKKAMVSLTKKH